jgi:hypothetical protein
MSDSDLIVTEGDVQNGTGKATNKATGNEYDGEWKDKKRHGKGVLRYGNGIIYDGEWMNGLRHGKGKTTYANGEEYEGKWINNKPDYLFPVLKASKKKQGRRR